MSTTYRSTSFSCFLLRWNKLRSLKKLLVDQVSQRFASATHWILNLVVNGRELSLLTCVGFSYLLFYSNNLVFTFYRWISMALVGQWNALGTLRSASTHSHPITNFTWPLKTQTVETILLRSFSSMGSSKCTQCICHCI